MDQSAWHHRCPQWGEEGSWCSALGGIGGGSSCSITRWCSTSSDWLDYVWVLQRRTEMWLLFQDHAVRRRGLQCTPVAGDTCHSHARSLESVCAAAEPRLSAGVCCDRTGTVCRGRGSSTALWQVEASITAAREVDATTDAATPTNKNTDQSSKTFKTHLK